MHIFELIGQSHKIMVIFFLSLCHVCLTSFFQSCILIPFGLINANSVAAQKKKKVNTLGVQVTESVECEYLGRTGDKVCRQVLLNGWLFIAI